MMLIVPIETGPCDREVDGPASGVFGRFLDIWTNPTK
jgi:hypothetical protein